MSTPEEREHDGAFTEKAMALAANGNQEALEYLRIWGGAFRLLDDLHDGDNGKVDVGLLAHLLLVAMPRNPFFGRFAAHLIPAHDIAINAWQDANNLPPANRKTILFADLGNEVAQVVAGLTGGYAYRRKVSMEIRRLLYRGLQQELDESQYCDGSDRCSTNHASLLTPH
jgi:hypothetical protein